MVPLTEVKTCKRSGFKRKNQEFCLGLMGMENRLMAAKGEGVGGGMKWEVGISRCKLLYVEWKIGRAHV